MTAWVFIVLACAGGFGAVARTIVDSLIQARARGLAPWGTITINLTGSFVIGVAVGLVSGFIPESWHHVLATGFLGGYTTFSTASFETVRLLQRRRWTAALMTGFGVLVAATGLAGLGMWLGSLI